jgi:DNA-binding IclR family transcriptional regulator
MGEKKSAPRSGTQTIKRAVELLREISARGHLGWQLSELAERCDLRRSTAHRMLKCLVDEGLVRQRAGDRHYIPGPTLFELGLSLPERGDLQYAARTRLAALARRTGGIAFFYVRSGDDFVCAARIGATDLNTRIYPGMRRPLVMSAGGAAMLTSLSQMEARETIQRNMSHLDDFGISEARVQSIRLMLRRSFEEGFGISAGNIVRGVNAFGLPLCDASGTPFASITLAGPARAFPLERRSEIRHLLQDAAEGLRAAPH